MENLIPIQTEYGILYGRDCIFLDMVSQDQKGHLTFTGEFSNPLLRQGQKWLSFKLTFHNLLACFSCELDTYENLVKTACHEGSCFDLVQESTWLQSFPVREDYKKDQFSHYRLSTYDYVYDIIAASYHLEIG